MAITNHERVGKALDLFVAGMSQYVVRELKAVFKDKWMEAAQDCIRADRGTPVRNDVVQWDAQGIISVMWNHWHDVFKRKLSHAERSMLSELRDVRNDWAHQRKFCTDDTERALDTIRRLLSAVSAKEATEVYDMRQRLRRLQIDEQARSQTRKSAALAIEGAPDTTMKPWREIATPHEDVASGRFQQAEFMADLSQVYRGEGTPEYRDPEEFFSRTFPTNGLTELLCDAMVRLSGKNGDPVIKLQTNFGGGKTHSMIALYHLFSGVAPTRLSGFEQMMVQAGVDEVPAANRAVIVGTAESPATPDKKPDGVEVRTLWGEMAWQLLGKEGYDLVADADKGGVNPGSDTLRELFKKAAPCMVLIDEWITFVRQLYDTERLPAGSFDANLSFAQSLTEAARAVPKTLVVASIPSSQIEVGGSAGDEALHRLEHTFARVESPWRPASAEESFEIVRRRLFQPITDMVARDAVVRRFSELYANHSQEFPSECREREYLCRMEAAYPIHPELFDRLYDDWSSLERFQRTRGILRLMASVIHILWEGNDNSLMILPAMIPLNEDDVRRELLRYLDDPWAPVIDRDIDGPNSIPITIDRKDPGGLGRYSACRRVARTLFMASAPQSTAQNRGVEDRRVKLGCAQPGESPAKFGDALRRLSDQATHLYVDRSRYWYSTQASVTRLAQDRAQQYSDEDVYEEIKKRLRDQQGSRGDFVKVHPCPDTTADVPDETGARLVIFGPEHPHTSGNDDSPAMTFAREILDQRGNIPRSYKNAVVFMAPDRARLRDLDAAVRHYMAWQSINAESTDLNLDAFSTNQARTKTKENDETIDRRIPETYRWVIAPYQKDTGSSIEMQAMQSSDSDLPAIKVSKRLVRDDALNAVFAGTRLRIELDKVPLWRGNHVLVSELAENFAKYTYLPRLKSTDTLLRAIEDGVALTSWSTDTFAFASGYDEESDRYLGLVAGQAPMVSATGADLLVKPDIASEQLEKERQTTGATAGSASSSGTTPEPGAQPTSGTPGATGTGKDEEKAVRRFYGSVILDKDRVGRDAGRIAEEVVAHLSALMKSEVKVTLEISAEVPDGVPDHVVRTVTENCNTLKFSDHGFEEE